MLLQDRETTITWNADDKVARIWTNDPAMIQRMDALCDHKSGAYICVNKTGQSANYRTSSKLIGFRWPTAEELTAEVRERAKARMQAKRTRSK